MRAGWFASLPSRATALLIPDVTHSSCMLNKSFSVNTKIREYFYSPDRIRHKLTIPAALRLLSTLTDESDPDTSLTQIQHALQAAEALKKDGKPRWMQLVGLIHDLGKLLWFFGIGGKEEGEGIGMGEGEVGQWSVAGDTFVVGAKPEGVILVSHVWVRHSQ